MKNTITKLKNGFKRIEYNPNYIHNHGKSEVYVSDDMSCIYSLPSKTDKEAYRVTLASVRGMLDKGMFGGLNESSYSLKDGVYNPDLDFSYLRRKDLTIVDIDNYIKTLESNLVKFDGDLKERIEETLSTAKAMKEDIKSDNTSESAD